MNTNDIVSAVAKRFGDFARSYEMQTLPPHAQRQVIELSGRTVSTKPQSEVWREWEEERNCMTREEHAAVCEAAGQRRQNVEDAARTMQRNTYQEAMNLYHGAALSRQRSREYVQQLVERIRR